MCADRVSRSSVFVAHCNTNITLLPANDTMLCSPAACLGCCRWDADWTRLRGRLWLSISIIGEPSAVRKPGTSYRAVLPSLRFGGRRQINGTRRSYNWGRDSRFGCFSLQVRVGDPNPTWYRVSSSLGLKYSGLGSRLQSGETADLTDCFHPVQENWRPGLD
jgi:hypothetical protein